MPDPLSDVLRLAEATSVVAGHFSAGGRWAVRFPAPEALKFGVLVEGTCLVRMDGQRKAQRLDAGDVMLVSGKSGYVLGSDLSAPHRSAAALFEGKLGRKTVLGDGAGCVAIAGGVALHPSAAPLLTEVLPPLVLVKASAPEAAPLRWLAEQLWVETRSSRPGAQVIAAQLAQLLFVQTLRGHLSGPDALPQGWLRALRDERLAPALHAMHADPKRAWTVDALAKKSAMSRTAFAVRFKALAGVAPLAYLARWRMQLAQQSMRQENASVAELAERLGYASESAFSQAFKRVTGASPRAYRRTL